MTTKHTQRDLRSLDPCRERRLALELVARKFVSTYEGEVLAQIAGQNDDMGTSASPYLDKLQAVADACVIEPGELPLGLMEAAVAAFGPDPFELTTDPARPLDLDVIEVDEDDGRPGRATEKKLVGVDVWIGGRARIRIDAARLHLDRGSKPEEGFTVIKVDTGRGGKAVYRVPKRALGAG